MEPKNDFGLVRRDPPPGEATVLTTSVMRGEFRLVLHCAWRETLLLSRSVSGESPGSMRLEAAGPAVGFHPIAEGAGPE